MKEVYRFDSEGFYIEPVILNEEDEIPEDCTEIIPPSYYKAKFTDGKWIEAMSEEEIDEIKNRSEEPSEIELLRQENEMNAHAIMELAEIILGGM